MIGVFLERYQVPQLGKTKIPEKKIALVFDAQKVELTQVEACGRPSKWDLGFSISPYCFWFEDLMSLQNALITKKKKPLVDF